MSIPTWFERELKFIDPDYYVFHNPIYGYYEIKKRIEVSRKVDDNGMMKRLRMNNPTLAVFERLNDEALNRLRKRKIEGLKYRGNMMAYMDDIVRQNQEAREKKRQLAAEMVTKGLMKIYNWGKTRQYDMGSVASPGGTHDTRGD